MKKNYLFLISFSLIIFALFIIIPKAETNEKIVSTQSITEEPESHPKQLEPNDHWYRMRSYPDGFNEQEFLAQMEIIKLQAEESAGNRVVDLTSPWLQEGPGNIGGRFNALAISPTDQNIIYAGAANGGIFKTIDGGITWDPIFDANAYLAIGEITLDPNDENTIYVGTGDKNFGGGSLLGNGVYKSTDAGGTWTQIGLEQTGIITEIAIDPTNSNKIFASTLGNTYEKTTERGIYRTIDGGLSWQNVLFISDSSGVIDMEMDPSNPNIIYASGFNRINLPFQAKVEGPDAKIFKTIDGGDNWVELGGGLPTTEESRIGLAISNTSPNTVYALYVDALTADVKDIYKTINGGTTWNPLNVSSDLNGALGGFGWYFGEVYINPYNNNQLVVPGVEMFTSMDAGLTWTQNVPDWWTYEVHADKHAILFLDIDSYIIATDGGLYKTDDNGITWNDFENIPVTQLYHIDVDPVNAGVYGGGAQDNGSMTGNAFSINSWVRLYGGDGFRLKILEQDAGSAYYETQNGGLNYNGTDDISVSPVDPDRVNWDMPYVINENNLELFVGTSMVQMMEFAPNGFYNSISGDLTKVGMGLNQGFDRYHTITEIELPIYDNNKLYVGTSDGLVWRGDQNGTVYDWDWTNITGTLPNRYVTTVRCSPNNQGTLFVGFSGYKLNEDIAYLYKSTDEGQTWTDVSGNLPGITVNDILIVPGYDDQYLFAALDGGVYFSEDGGTNWNYVGIDLPFATISELELDYPNKKLIAGTYSRSIWSYDVSWLDNLVDPVSVNEAEQSDKFKCYPNPVIDIVYFTGSEGENFYLYDAKGNLVFQQKIILSGKYGQANLGWLSSGIYFYQCGKESGKIIKK